MRESTRLDRLLIAAALEGNAKAVQQALAQGADVHAMDELALRKAVENGLAKIVALLLEHGADGHAVLVDALSVAVTKGHRMAAVVAVLKEWADTHPESMESIKERVQRRSRPSAGRICRVAAGLSSWTPAEEAYLQKHPSVIAYHDQLQAALQEVLEERGDKSNLQTRIDEAKNKTPENDDDRDRGPSRGGR